MRHEDAQAHPAAFRFLVRLISCKAIARSQICAPFAYEASKIDISHPVRCRNRPALHFPVTHWSRAYQQ
jgi:hypothetical protein